MNTATALLIATLSCADPAMNFREFYAQTRPGDPAFPRGFHYEIASDYLMRLAQATADFVDYRAARADKYGRAR